MTLGEYGKYASLGISLVLTTAVYLFLGYRAGTWLDGRWGTEPTFLIVGIVLGMILSVVSMVKELMMLRASRDRPRARKTNGPVGRDSEKKNFPMRAHGRQRPQWQGRRLTVEYTLNRSMDLAPHWRPLPRRWRCLLSDFRWRPPGCGRVARGHRSITG